MKHLTKFYDVFYCHNDGEGTVRFKTIEERNKFLATLPSFCTITTYETFACEALTEAEIERMAIEIRDWLISHELWMDVNIYFNGKAFATDMNVGGRHEFAYNNPNKLFVIENINPNDYFDYAGEILSMSFDGALYDLINYNYGSNLLEEFNAIFNKYGCYYELGNCWNLTTVYKYEVVKKEDIA